jgi:predicted  nucleic acid-binding Zn-ribbon protein
MNEAKIEELENEIEFNKLKIKMEKINRRINNLSKNIELVKEENIALKKKLSEHMELVTK